MGAAFPRWSSQTKLVVTLLLLALFVYLPYRFRFFLASLALAVILAYILTPLVKLFQNRLRKSRVVATLLCYLLLLSIIAILPLGLFPLLASQFKELSEDAQGFFSGSGQFNFKPICDCWTGDRWGCVNPAINCWHLSRLRPERPVRKDKG